MTAKGPQPIKELLAQLMARRGYARLQAVSAADAAWKHAAGELLARHTRPGAVRRGTLEVLVANSTLMQELSFQKADLIAQLTRSLPEAGIKNLRFRVGPLD